MTRLIDADALLDEWLKQKDPTFKCWEMETFFEDMCSKWIDILHDAPTVDIIGQCEGCIYERPHGEWYQIKDHKVMGEGYMWHCSICDYKVYQDSSADYPHENFCPNCGADMRNGFKSVGQAWNTEQGRW